jgi:tetratricopeptide (TPR) repeat protein
LKRVSQVKSEKFRRIFIEGHKSCMKTLNLSPRAQQLVNDVFACLLMNDYGKAEWLALKDTKSTEKVISLTLLSLTYFLDRRPAPLTEALNEVFETNPDFYPAINIAGDILFQQSELETVEALLRRSLELESSQRMPRILLAELYKTTGRHDEALAILDGLRKDFPDDGVVWSKICQIHDEMGSIHVAERMLRAELQRNEVNFGAWHNLGVIYHDLFRFDEAEKALLRALEVYSGDTNTMLTLGKVFKSTARNEKAIDAFRRVLEVDPEDSEALFELAGILYFQGNNDEARSLYQRAVEMDPELTERSMMYFLGAGLRIGPVSGTAEE